MTAPIAVALDAPDLATAVRWARSVAPHVSTLKIGLELFLRDGAEAVHAVRAAAPEVAIFLDVKLHDIPATVAGACHSMAPLMPDFLTVHASGGVAMVRAAAQALPSTRVTAVTVLTSLAADEVSAIGWSGTPQEAVLRLARLAVAAGARALVCSPQEVAAVRIAVGPSVMLITPGVRPSGSDLGDQSRVATPRAALDAGADLLVIGRPITGAFDPGGAAARIAAGLTSL